MKNSLAPAARLFNWNIISEELDKIGIILETDKKSLCIAGDGNCILEIFGRIDKFLSRALMVKLDFNDLTKLPPPVKIGTAEEKSARRGNRAPVQKKK